MLDFRKLDKIAVIGIGSWGTALANELAKKEIDVLIYSHEKEVAAQINNGDRNQKYLPEYPLSEKLKATAVAADISEYPVLINCIPTQYIAPYYRAQEINLQNKYIVNASKGVENKTLRLISQIFKDEYQIEENAFAHLAGPSHAELLLRQDLTTIVCSSHNSDLSEFVIKSFSSDYLRVYHSEDVIGSQIGGALKNVIAIAAGIIDGFEFGENAKAALITRGLAEITRLGVAMKANPLTFSGLTGIGDLIVTCMSKHSRNWQFGNKLSTGSSVAEIKEEMLMVAEGVATSQSAVGLAKKYNTEMPISSKVFDIIYGENIPKETSLKAIKSLMTRDITSEVW